MADQNCAKRDPYAFSLRGLTAAASFGPIPALADDRLNRARDERLRAAREAAPGPQPDPGTIDAWGRFWLRRRRRAA